MLKRQHNSSNHHHHHHHHHHIIHPSSSSPTPTTQTLVVSSSSSSSSPPESCYTLDYKHYGNNSHRSSNCCAYTVLMLVLVFILTCILVTIATNSQEPHHPSLPNPSIIPLTTPVPVRFDYSNTESNYSLPREPSSSGGGGPQIVSEFIHLYKLPPPLDNDDLSENLKRTTATTSTTTHHNRFNKQQQSNNDNIKHHYYNTGVFRPPRSRLWDPHPQYIFHAFNRRFHLVLNQISKQHSFIVPGFKVTTHARNGDHESWVKRGSSSNGGAVDTGGGGGDGSLDEFEGCFYNGYVLGDLESSVAVSLCGGMTGHIRTSTGSYFIEPRRYTNDLEHEIYKIVTHPHDDIITTNTQQHQSSSSSSSSTTTTPTNMLLKKNLKITPYDYYSDEDYDSDEEQPIHKQPSITTSRSKRSLSTERYVELTVVTDQTMSRYHGENLKHYVLTLLSIVALVYRDASIGNPVNIVLVNFHVLTDTDFSTNGGLSSSSNSNGNSTVRGTSASEMLRNFCKWQKEHNHPDDRHALHHDTALLLTRETICRNPWVGKCDTLGLAELGTMCDHYASCAIVQDNGLSAAFTIAHELGHVMNMPHDDDYKCQGFVDKVEGVGGDGVSVVQHYVMSRMLDHNTYPWAWSRCSRHFLTEFLDAGHGYCLEDKPHSNLLSNDDENSVEDSNSQSIMNNQQPGEIFSEHKQCQLVFGPKSQLCSYMPPCRRLWCTNHGGPESEESEGCRTQHMPWADGTRCGVNKWCQRGQCVLKDLEKLKVINGDWGDWQDYGECSRSCGGGVRKSYRECDNPRPKNGGKYCVGPRVRYESCNTFDCSNSSTGYDFRASQCGDYNGDNFNIHGLPEDVVWVPKYNGISPKDRCKLFCRVQGSSSYYLLKEKVVDGTPCGIDTFDVCVNGACLPAGCDRRLHSTSTLDICGICGGDGSTCTTTQGSYNSTNYGYNVVLRIPSGASNIDIRQRSYDNTARDDNYLALLDPLTNEYILNGHFVVSMFRKTIAYGGSILEYSGSDQIVERINSSSRALKRDLEVRVLSVGKLKPPDIVFQYVISTVSETGNSGSAGNGQTTQQQQPESFEWVGRRRGNEPSCSSVCSGVTVPFSEWECQRKVGSSQGVAIDGTYCANVQKPHHVPEPCNTHCTLGYRVSCPESCVHARNRSVECVRTLLSTNTSQRINDKYCVNSGISVPDQPDCVRECRERGARWRYTQWSDCNSGRCSSNGSNSNNGYQMRNVWCQRFNWRSLVDPGVDHFVVVGDDECKGSGEKPVSRRSCRARDQGVCGEWKIDQWSPCSTTCGPGRTRALYACVLKTHSQTQILPPDFCVHNRKPTVERSCEVVPCAHYSTSNWSQCDCTTNTETRNITCLVNENAMPDNSACEALNVPNKPLQARDCLNAKCVKYVVSEWSRDCRFYNGNYYRYRSVSCESGSCSGAKPESKMECGEWRVESGWGVCNGSCAVGVGVEVREVACYLRGVKTSESDCDGLVIEKPASTRKCFHTCATSGHNHVNMKSLALGGTRGEEGYGGGVVNPHLSSGGSGGGGGSGSSNGAGDYYYVNNNNGRGVIGGGTGASYKWVSGSWGKCTRMTTHKSSSSSCPPPSSVSLFRKHRQVKCVSEVSQPSRRINTVPTSYCNPHDQPESSTNCTSQELSALTPCPIWITSEFSSCLVAKDTEINCVSNTSMSSSSSGSSSSSSVIMHGFKRRVVNCIHDTTNSTVDEVACAVDGGGTGYNSNNKPEGEEACVVVGDNRKYCSFSFHWRVGNWTSCLVDGKKVCGGKGRKTRSVECVREWRGSGKVIVVVVVGDENCVGSGRSRVGGSGNGGKRSGSSSSSSSRGSSNRKPRSGRDCTRVCSGGGGGSGIMMKRNPFKWVLGDWSTCSRPCGGYGLRSRRVTCHRTTPTTDWIDPDPLPTQISTTNNTNYCPPPKPKEFDYCMVSETCPADSNNSSSSLKNTSTSSSSSSSSPQQPQPLYSWTTSNYSACACPPENSTTTTTITTPSYSFQKRRVSCYNSKTSSRSPARHCAHIQKPKRKRKCECNAFKNCAEVKERLLGSHQTPVDGEYLLSVGGKLGVSVYCHGMTSSNSVPQEYINVNEDTNFSEIYDKRLIRPETCPRNGTRMSSCECVLDRNRRVGLTRWKRVRVNITNLRVDVNDFTFTSSSQDQIPYATAGDCYSSSMVCPQGRFSLDLRNTSFSFSPISTWTTTGHRATMRVARKNFSKDHYSSQYIQGKCGGYCGTCNVNKSVGLRLDVV